MDINRFYQEPRFKVVKRADYIKYAWAGIVVLGIGAFAAARMGVTKAKTDAMRVEMDEKRLKRKQELARKKALETEAATASATATATATSDPST
eukprot:m.80476 g.80476  ORF g.80476 m.80476 type:complete len:94 (-) comp12602_c0_seq1:447-728(-)